MGTLLQLVLEAGSREGETFDEDQHISFHIGPYLSIIIPSIMPNPLTIVDVDGEPRLMSTCVPSQYCNGQTLVRRKSGQVLTWPQYKYQNRVKSRKSEQSQQSKQSRVSDKSEGSVRPEESKGSRKPSGSNPYLSPCKLQLPIYCC
jgi:hypothetical protein